MIIRVFPRKTSMTPVDHFSFIGDPPLFRPPANIVHVSVSFTWDIEEGYRLRKAWAEYYPIVMIGGPAFEADPNTNDPGEFVSGMYLKSGVTITSRGCSRKCPWCLVPIREGKIKLLDIKSGWIIQDNNILATPKEHQKKVYAMLKRQKKRAKFSGGMDARLVDDWVADQLRNLKIYEIFLAADTQRSLKILQTAVEKLSFLNRRQLRCYVMIGYNGETIDEAKERLQKVWDIGCLPFSQLYQPVEEYLTYSREWRDLNRKWSRPAAMFANKELNE